MSEISPDTLCESIEENKGNVILIWFESTINTSEDIKNTIGDLRIISSIDICINYMKSIKNKKILLIIPGNDATKLLQGNTNLPQLDSVFIRSENQDQYVFLFDNFPEIVRTFDTRDKLVTLINEAITNVNNQMKMFAFYDQNQQAVRDLSEQSAKFLWFQLFNDVILHLPRDDKAMKEMLDICRQYYRDNRQVLKRIGEFNENSCTNNCIFWYTKNAFVYRLMNKALRTEDNEQIYMFRYYIADLSNQLAREYQKIKSGLEETIQLYRGTIMTKRDAESLRANKGKLVATNGYWSTSRNRSCALIYIAEHPNNSDTVAVLFEIECNLQDAVICADISGLSEFPEEKEVLFDVGAVFKIEKISQEKEGDTDVMIVHIKTSGEGQEIVKQYKEENRAKMKDESPTIMLCTLLKRMGKVEKSLKLLGNLLQYPAEENLAHIHNRIGIALRVGKKYDPALEHFEKAYELCTDSNPPQKKYAALVLYNKGRVYDKKEQYEMALGVSEKAIKILEEEAGTENIVTAKLYSSMGRIYLHQKCFNGALRYQEKALEIRQKYLSSEHVVIAFSYADIGNIYSHQGDYEEALQYHLKSLELRKKYLPSDHHNITWSLHCVEQINIKKGNSNTVLNFYFTSLRVSENCVSTVQNNSLRAYYHERIASTYMSRKDKNKSLKHYKEAVQIRRQSEPINHLILSQDLDQIVGIYKSKRDNENILIYSKEAVDVQKQIVPLDYFILAKYLDAIALECKSMNNLNDSLNYYKEVVQIRENHLPSDQRDLPLSLYGLATVYEKLGQYTMALEYYNREMNVYTYIHGYPPDHYCCRTTKKHIDRIEKLME